MNANTNPETFSDWFHYMLRNKQQASALSGGLVIMIYSGQMLAWGIFNYNIQYEDEFSNAFMPTLSRLWLFWLVASWFIAAAVAAYLGAKLVENIRKIKIYIIGYSLMMISSCFFIIFSNWATMILVARIIAGISHGISFISVLVHAGEICTPKLRGMIVSSIQISIFIGVFIASLSNMQRFAVGTYQINFNLITGIIGIVLTLGGLILLYFLHIESPVYFIRKQQSQKAQTIMMKLRNEDELSDETRNDLEDIHKMFGEDFTTRDEMFEKKNIQSLTWMIILRVAFVCSFNMPLNLVWLSSIFTTIDSGEIDPSAVSLIALFISYISNTDSL
ncbi:CLUMA_CG018677, isoform A [Clunio marinus]|uniref:CLUMA_CG018677, isoform A n=1 Tax=Clunio marinus TaxID=568069 RepID=A0A1J1IZD6_9DIPT|nr:CLUMA_CG018677, isoform A [Clunio marinus]